MWILGSVAVWFIILQSNVVLLRTINEIFGPVYLHTRIGVVPYKYHTLNQDDQKASQKFTRLVKMLVPAIPTGFRSMPPLDPFEKKDIHSADFNIHSMIRGKLYLNNLVVTGLQNVTVDEIELRMRNYRVDIGFQIPQLLVEIDFEVDATLGYFGLVPLDFSGHVSLKLTGISMTSTIGAKKEQVSDTRQVFQLNSAAIDGKVQNIQVTVTNLRIGDGDEGLDTDFSIASWMESLKEEVTSKVIKEAIKEVNKALRAFSVDVIYLMLS